MPQRVTVLYWGEQPRTTMLALVVEEHQLLVINSPDELTEGDSPADVVVVDVPARYRPVACEQVRRHYRGQLIVLDAEDSSHDLPPDPNRMVLSGPFGIHELSAALGGSAPMQPTDAGRALPRRAQVQRADSSSGMERSMVAEVVPWLAPSWRERRLVRLSTISVTAVVLFVAAFVLVTRSTGCGSACDELTGADLTAPSSTPVTAAAVGPTAAASSVGPAAAGGSQADAATSSSSRTTAGPGGAPTPTSPPDPTRPPTTAPPTTAPPTTAPTTTAPTTTAAATTISSITTKPPHTTKPSHTTKP